MELQMMYKSIAIKLWYIARPVNYVEMGCIACPKQYHLGLDEKQNILNQPFYIFSFISNDI